MQSGQRRNQAFQRPIKCLAHAQAKNVIMVLGGGLSFILIILWPCLALPAQVFSLGYFTFWVVLIMVWALVRLLSLKCMQSC